MICIVGTSDLATASVSSKYAGDLILRFASPSARGVVCGDSGSLSDGKCESVSTHGEQIGRAKTEAAVVAKINLLYCICTKGLIQQVDGLGNPDR